jgi:TPR repeat protein
MALQSGVTFTSELAGRVHEPMAKACQLGHQAACPRAAEMKQLADKGLPTEWPVMCKARRGQACISIGLAHQSGEDNYKQDTALAADFFRQACAMKVGLGCTYLGVLIADKQVEGKPKDAQEAFNSGCELGEPVACRKLGLGHWDKKKFKDAVTWLDKACGLDDSVACASVGQLYVAGKGTPKDLDKGKAALDKACKAGEDVACKELAKLAK